MTDDQLRTALFEAACNEIRLPPRVQFCRRSWCVLWDMARERGHPEWAADAKRAAYEERRRLDAANVETAKRVREG